MGGGVEKRRGDGPFQQAWTPKREGKDLAAKVETLQQKLLFSDLATKGLK